MGTSTASGGPKPDVNLDPPWLDDVVDKVGDGCPVPLGDPDPSPVGASGLAPPARYGDARKAINKYLKNGDTDSLRRALGHYSRTGSGGAAAAASRMRATTSAGAALFSFLNTVSQGASPQAIQWVNELRATTPTADDVIDAIVRELSPSGGSADEEAFRDAMAFALHELLKDTSVDPLAMGVDNIWELMKSYLATEAANRVCFDLGPIFESRKVDPLTAVAREREMRRFVRNEIGLHIELLRRSNPNPTRGQLEGILQEALKMTFELFEADL